MVENCQAREVCGGTERKGFYPILVVTWFNAIQLKSTTLIEDL